VFILAITPGDGLAAPRWEPVLQAGIDGLLVREPRMRPRDLLAALRWAGRAAPGLELWVAGRLDVALAAGCGLHVPERHPRVPAGLLDLSQPIHDSGQVPDRAGARQLLLSPIFPVPGKGPAWGVAKLHAVLDALPPLASRLLALGGITPANAGPLRHPRLAGVAVIRGLWSAPDPAGAVAGLRRAWADPG